MVVAVAVVAVAVVAVVAVAVVVDAVAAVISAILFWCGCCRCQPYFFIPSLLVARVLSIAVQNQFFWLPEIDQGVGMGVSEMLRRIRNEQGRNKNQQ